MSRLFAALALLIVSIDLNALPVTTGSELPAKKYALGDAVPLSESDLQKITLQVLQRHPLLSASPGIKFASAQRSVRSIDIANIIYLPHAQSAGIKEAFEVRCLRQEPEELWRCDEVSLRRYLQLESQSFEVRLTTPLRTDEALALIQATRSTAKKGATDTSVAPETAIMISRDSNGYLVAWGSPEGYPSLMVRGFLREGGDPANPDDWQARMFKSPE